MTWQSLFNNYLATKPGLQNSTKQIYSALENHLTSFQPVVSLENINNQWLDRFRQYLGDKGNIKSATVHKYFKSLKSLLKYAKQMGLPVNESFRDYQILTVTESDDIALTREEVELIRKAQIPPEKEYVRDFFLFLCFAELRISDGQPLQWDQLQ